MDRIAPTQRPDAPAVGGQSWRELLFLHWTVDAERLADLLPTGLSVDTYEGCAYVGLVPFAMHRVRPRRVPPALGLAFLECNVRTYVHLDGAAPGVYFFSLDAASRLAVTVARRRWSLPYFHAAMGLRIDDDGMRHYALQRRSAAGPELAVRYQPDAALGATEPGTLEHFLVERYLLYVERRGRLYRGQVHHPPYPLHAATVEALYDECLAAAGFTGPGLTTDRLPDTVHYSPGVDVEIFPLRRI